MKTIVSMLLPSILLVAAIGSPHAEEKRQKQGIIVQGGLTHRAPSERGIIVQGGRNERGIIVQGGRTKKKAGQS